ncbi:YrbL family protein [Marinomonas ostreistagni]|uniref:YrbL family protein n=1 Tax=Marinomonas ostreistagni TaxID=359209 RepID=UPI0019509390|nr:hypothetical protein [Marinomonas ostreistagni]
MNVTLSDPLYLAKGSCRTVFKHPSHNDLCIKVNHNPRKDRNITEIVFYHFHRRHALDFIAQYKGTVATNMGKGVVTEIVKDHDGKVSKSLEEYIEANLLSIEQGFAYIKALQEKVLKCGVLLHDDGIQNILMRKATDGRLTPVLVDGFGPRDMSFKSLSRMVLSPLARKKSKQVIQGMLRRTEKMRAGVLESIQTGQIPTF